MTKKTRKWLGLLALIPAIAMVFTDQAVLPVALPTIQKHLNATHNELWWCINSYLLVSAVFLLAGGKWGDRVGYRKSFLWGISIFALSSALCGMSATISWLIAARALQGVGAALLIPASAPLIMSLFSQSERGKAMGINISVSSLFLIFAPFIGGYLTQAFSWRWIFWINLPLAVVGIILVYFFLPPSPTGRGKIDLLSLSYFAVGASSLVMLIMQTSDGEFFSLRTAILALISLVSSFLLILQERRSKHPFIDFSLFRHPIYRAVSISVFATQFVLMITVYRAVFVQDALGWSPTESGTIFFFTSIPILFMSLVGGWLADRQGPKLPLALGFTLLIYSFFWLAFFVKSSLAVLVLGFIAFSTGVPLIFTPSYSSAMGVIPQTKAGSAFGILATIRALSATLGVAIISSLEHFLGWRSFKSLVEENGNTRYSTNALWESFTTKSIPHNLETFLETSQIQSFSHLHLLIAFTLIAVFALVFTLYHRKASHHLPEAPAEGWD